MAEFEAKVHTISVEPHPDADRIELAVVGGFRSIVVKGAYKTGDLAAYIPSGSIIPDDILDELGLTGKLSGSKKNRLKEQRFRGVLSEGLVYPLTGNRLKQSNWLKEGDDVTNSLGIVKWEPFVPAHLQGQVENPTKRNPSYIPDTHKSVGGSASVVTINYDIENFKKWPNVLQPGEEVSFTEKVHGTWCCIGWQKDVGYMVTSKGMSAKGLVLKINEANERNAYVEKFKEYKDRFDKLRESLEGRVCRADVSGLAKNGVYLLGEIYGRIQDLTYGETGRSFAVFDVYVGNPGQGRYLDRDEYEGILSLLSIPVVPELYRGPFSANVMKNYAVGDTVIGKGFNIREGIVIRTVPERRDAKMGRVILKSISEKYLLRKKGTEYN